MEKQIESGTYSIYEEQVILKNRDGLITEKCKLKDKTKLYCEFYASLYVKK